MQNVSQEYKKTRGEIKTFQNISLREGYDVVLSLEQHISVGGAGHPSSPEQI